MGEHSAFLNQLHCATEQFWQQPFETQCIAHYMFVSQYVCINVRSAYYVSSSKQCEFKWLQWLQWP